MISITVNGVAYQVPSNASDTNWAAKQVAFEQALATAVNTALAAPSFTSATLINAWAASGTAPGYYKDPLGFVHLRGGLASGASASVAFVLPSGYRPAATTILIGAATSGAFTAAITTNGNVTITNLTAGADVNAFASLAGMSFSTAA